MNDLLCSCVVQHVIAMPRVLVQWLEVVTSVINARVNVVVGRMSSVDVAISVETATGTFTAPQVGLP